MIDYDSFSRCHLTDIFAFHAGAKELNDQISQCGVINQVQLLYYV